VLEEQSRLRAQMESEPVRFFVHELEPLLDAARAEVAAFVGADAEDVVFVRNATEAANGVLRSIAPALSPGDELLTTDHVYGACKNAMAHVAKERGAKVVIAKVPFPLSDPGEVVDALVRAVTPRTRLALVDHVTSPTGLVFPIAEIVRALDARGVDTLVDGAHGPGMVELDLRALSAAYYVANLHKHTCAPKGAGFLFARRDRQDGLHPAIISHGYASERPRKRFLEEWDWVGTDDPTPMLTVPFALRYVASLVDGGWPRVRAQNRALALEARALLAEALSVALPAPDDMIGTLAALPLPDGAGGPPLSALYADPLQRALYDRHRIEVPIPPWPAPPKRLVRISAHLHNARDDYERLASALRAELHA
jgi:isopenicillin-N epimerase